MHGTPAVCRARRNAPDIWHFDIAATGFDTSGRHDAPYACSGHRHPAHPAQTEMLKLRKYRHHQCLRNDESMSQPGGLHPSAQKKQDTVSGPDCIEDDDRPYACARKTLTRRKVSDECGNRKQAQACIRSTYLQIHFPDNRPCFNRRSKLNTRKSSRDAWPSRFSAFCSIPTRSLRP